MAEERISNIVESLLDGIHGIAKSETIVGEPQQAGEATIIPVHKLKIAFGVGTGGAGAAAARASGDTDAMGAGGSVQLDPIAAIAVGKDGTPRILTVDQDPENAWNAILEQVPDLLTKVMGAIGSRVDERLAKRAAAQALATPEASSDDALSEEDEEQALPMCELLGMECNVPTDIVFSFTGLAARGGAKGPHADGWGLALYEGHAARVFLEPAAAARSPLAEFVRKNPIKTLLAVAHVRRKTRGGIALSNTHPFVRELWGRHWVFAHNGTVKNVRELALGRYAPIGDTDSEYAFCVLLDRVEKAFGDYPKSARALSKVIADAGAEIGKGGTFNFLLGDGRRLYARCATKLAYLVRRAPFKAATLADEDLRVNFAEVTTPNDRVAVVATVPLTNDEAWTHGNPGEMWVFRRGELVLTLPSI